MVKLATLLKRTAYTLLALAAVIYIYIFLGSIDSEEPQYQNFLGELMTVDPALNGYVYLEASGLADDDFITSEEVNKIRQSLKSGEHDAEFTQQTVAMYRDQINAFKIAAAMPYLQYSGGDDPTELPSFMSLFNGIRLILLEAKLLASEGRIGEATDSLLLGWQFSEKLKRMNGYLVSYMIGIVSQDEVLTSLQRMIADHDFSEAYLIKIIEALNSVEPLSENEFEPVMQGELRYFYDYLGALVEQPFSKRWNYFVEQSSWAPDDEGWYPSRKRQLQGTLQAFFPKFYIHRNQILNVMSVELASVVSWSGMNCGELDGLVTKEYEWFPEVTWGEILLPNQGQNTLDNHRGQFKEYLIRRCLAYTQIEAIKAILALNLYEKVDKDHKVDSIDVVYSELLDRPPIDHMSGRNLKYSKKNRWLYSVGENLYDDGGSSDSCYFKHCFADEHCKNNPTFPVNLDACKFDEEIE